MPSTFMGDITILAMQERDDSGVLGASSFNAVNSTKNQVISGNTSMINAVICVTIYDENNLPVNLHPFDTTILTPPPPPGSPTPPPTTPPAVDTTTLSPDTPPASPTTANWSVLVPKYTLGPGKHYVIIAQDSDGLASTSQSITTTA